MKVLLIDNYDSFTFNLSQYLQELGAEVVVKKNDELLVDDIPTLNPSHIVISPGPGHPEREGDFGICREVILEWGSRLPLLGVCLGHQGIVTAFGGKVVQAPEAVHGKKRLIEHDGKGLFQGLPNPMEVMRYHSLVADEASLPACLRVTARSLESPKLIMAIEHESQAIYGIQFHPESVGTPEGMQVLKRFLELKLK